jgi:hypothetical protein
MDVKLAIIRQELENFDICLKYLDKHWMWRNATNSRLFLFLPAVYAPKV